jgi:thymidine kinase
MSELYFLHGAMNSGKSTALLQAAHNYEERGQANREVDFLVTTELDLRKEFQN